MTTYIEQLRRVPGLRRSRRRDLARVAQHAERIDAAPGQTIIGAGDRWTGACIIECGEATAHVDGWTLRLSTGTRLERTDGAAPAIAVCARTAVRALLVGRNCPAPFDGPHSGDPL